ncbi:MAG: Csu type fimbrial protein [Serratia bockelmannii]
MKKNLMVLTSVVILLCANGVANAAGTLQGTLGVTLTIGAGCTIAGGDSSGAANNFGSISFGTYPSLNNIIDATATGSSGGSLTLNCTKDTEYTVALGNGLNNASGTQRRMVNSAKSDEYINYNLYQDAEHSVVWGSGVNAMTATADGTPKQLIVYGRVPASATTPNAGTYNDTVTMTVSW